MLRCRACVVVPLIEGNSPSLGKDATIKAVSGNAKKEAAKRRAVVFQMCVPHRVEASDAFVLLCPFKVALQLVDIVLCLLLEREVCQVGTCECSWH